MRSAQGNQRVSIISRMMAAVGLIAPVIFRPEEDDRRYGIVPSNKRRRGGTPKKMITRAHRRVRQQMQKASRRINRKLNRRHPG